MEKEVEGREEEVEQKGEGRRKLRERGEGRRKLRERGERGRAGQ